MQELGAARLEIALDTVLRESIEADLCRSHHTPLQEIAEHAEIAPSKGNADTHTRRSGLEFRPKYTSSSKHTILQSSQILYVL